MEKFKISSGVVVCSDPCYDLPSMGNLIVSGVKNGEWDVMVENVENEEWGYRISSVTIKHVDIPFLPFNFNEPIGECGVDSGQFGFFDKGFYRNDNKAEELIKHDFGSDYDRKDGDAWYRACCHLTLGAESYGVMENGCVSSSGFGDGVYPVFGIKDPKGEYVIFNVTFIVEYDEDDLEDDFEEESFI